MGADSNDDIPASGDGRDGSHASGADAGLEREPDYDRDLGVIEAITYVTRSCPSGSVIRAAEQSLAAIEAGGADALRQQAYFVLTSIKGWRGERARQVHRSLTRYLEESSEEKK